MESFYRNGVRNLFLDYKLKIPLYIYLRWLAEKQKELLNDDPVQEANMEASSELGRSVDRNSMVTESPAKIIENKEQSEDSSQILIWNIKQEPVELPEPEIVPNQNEDSLMMSELVIKQEPPEESPEPEVSNPAVVPGSIPLSMPLIDFDNQDEIFPILDWNIKQEPEEAPEPSELESTSELKSENVSYYFPHQTIKQEPELQIKAEEAPGLLPHPELVPISFSSINIYIQEALPVLEWNIKQDPELQLAPEEAPALEQQEASRSDPEQGPISITVSYPNASNNIIKLAQENSPPAVSQSPVKADSVAFKCTKCLFELGNASNASFHMVQCNQSVYAGPRKGNGKYLCMLCSETFHTACSLKFHKKRKNHHSDDKKSLMCEECCRIFTSSKYLAQHYRSYHMGDLPFNCNVCHFKSECKESFDDHVAKHQNKPFVCSLCESSYFHQIDLDRHEITSHTGKYPYVCHHCGKGFLRNNILQNHIRTIH